MSFKIKNFGNSLECGSVEELKLALFEFYKNTSISIISNKGTHFVDVQSDGSLVDSYTSLVIDIDFFRTEFSKSKIQSVLREHDVKEKYKLTITHECHEQTMIEIHDKTHGNLAQRLRSFECDFNNKFNNMIEYFFTKKGKQHD